MGAVEDDLLEDELSALERSNGFYQRSGAGVFGSPTETLQENSNAEVLSRDGDDFGHEVFYTPDARYRTQSLESPVSHAGTHYTANQWRLYAKEEMKNVLARSP